VPSGASRVGSGNHRHGFGRIRDGWCAACGGHTRPVLYVALGDSYAAGQGASLYEDEVCNQSRNESYPVLLDSKSFASFCSSKRMA
jgi:hypothetical protein